MPTEQEIEHYCLHHELERPRNPKLWVVGGAAILYVACMVVVSSLLHHFVGGDMWLWLNILPLLSIPIIGTPAALACIRLYQRYAPERIRRKCVCQPSCSEYAIAAFSKLGFFRGLWKTYIRLFKTCGGHGYVYDPL